MDFFMSGLPFLVFFVVIVGFLFFVGAFKEIPRGGGLATA